MLFRSKAVLRRMQGAAAAPTVAEGELLKFEGWKLDAGSRSLWDRRGREVYPAAPNLAGGGRQLLVQLASEDARDHRINGMLTAEERPL